MTRETDVVEALVEMADTLVDDYDVIDVLTKLADRCVTVLGASAAGVMLATIAGELRLAASSSEKMRILELFELQAQEGPCLDAFRTGEPVDRMELSDSSEPWPLFTPAALEAGFRSVIAIPLRLRDATIGALNLFAAGETPMTPGDLVVARAFADLAAISVLQHRAATEAQRLNDQLAGALTSRIVIEQAKGVVAERSGVGVEAAFDRLRAYARSNHMRLTDVALGAVDGSVDPLA